MKTHLSKASYIIVDDDEDDRYLMRLAIQQMGRQLPAKEFSNGQEFLDYITRDTSEEDQEDSDWLLVLDINMPVLDGYQTLLQLRQNPRWQHVPVLILSTSEDPRQMSDLLEAGANAYYTKPHTFGAYSQLLTTAFEPWLSPEDTN